MDAPIKLEQFAQLCAEVDAGIPLEDLLAREKMAARGWELAREVWQGKMAEEAQQKRFVLTNRYNTAYGTKRRLLASRKPAAAAAPVAQSALPAVMGATLGVDDAALQAEVMPFRAAAMAAYKAAAAGETVGLHAGGTQGLATAAPPSSGNGRRFTLEQFASLTVEISLAPAEIAGVRARYGLDEAAHRTEAAQWQAAFACDSQLFTRYRQLLGQYRDWFALQRR